jgi:hypothetical protein
MMVVLFHAVGGRTLERPSCGGVIPTAETTLFPAYSARSRKIVDE